MPTLAIISIYCPSGTYGSDIVVWVCVFRFISGQPSDYHRYFEIALSSGQVRQVQPVDRARVKQFTITVQVSGAAGLETL